MSGCRCGVVRQVKEKEKESKGVEQLPDVNLSLLRSPSSYHSNEELGKRNCFPQIQTRGEGLGGFRLG